MSEEREIDEIIAEEQVHHWDVMEHDPLALAALEIANLLASTGDSFGAICADIETVE